LALFATFGAVRLFVVVLSEPDRCHIRTAIDTSAVLASGEKSLMLL
jgi:hypothetical protein